MKFFLPFIYLIIFRKFRWELSLLLLSVIIIFIITNNHYLLFNFNIEYYENGLILLTIWISLLILIVRLIYFNANNNFARFFISIFILIIILFMCFISSNFLIFYIIFELSVIPTFILILGWGYSIERLQAGLYIFIYTFVTALPFFVFLIYFQNENGYLNLNLSSIFINSNNYLNFWWIIISIVFLVKFPIFIVHIWLPKAHVEAPVAGSIILAGVLLKLGGYGFWKSFQYSIIFFELSNLILLSLSIIGAIYIRLICIRQIDIKCLIAYSSVAHIGPVLASILSFVWLGWIGAFFIIIAHGICSSGLFFALNSSYEQFKSRSALLIKRIRIFNPILIFWWFFLCCRNISCPPTINFISELMIIIPIIIIRSPYSFLFLSILLIIRGVYSVYLFININHGEYIFKYIFIITNLRDLLRFLLHRLPLLIFAIFIQYLF